MFLKKEKRLSKRNFKIILYPKNTINNEIKKGRHRRRKNLPKYQKIKNQKKVKIILLKLKIYIIIKVKIIKKIN